MKNFYDVLQFLKTFGVYVHVGKRLWDIEVAALEVDNLFRADVISQKDYSSIKLILENEHRKEECRA
ncbi:YqgQ family protein [Leuconostoc palmae]|uniref:YqgQ family protein n=1 Tax=Leuconostoc palmae TaxID=501487 RepID=UPI001C7D8442|nr:YqgQ family protein [Leuconostoc palmae]